MAKATLIFRDRRVDASGGIVEMIVWQTPEPVPPSAHGFKYSLYYGRDGKRIIGFDNERGKGDHLHLDGEECPYQFMTLEDLLADFYALLRERQNLEADDG